MCGVGELLRVPWPTRRSNQSIIKEINPEYSLEGLMLKLKLQCFGHLMWGADSIEKTWMLRKTEGRRRRTWERTRCLSGITYSMEMNLSKLQDMVKETWHPWGHKEEDTTEQLNNSNLPWSDGAGCHDLSFWMLGLKPVFSLSSFTFTKRLFSSSSLSTIIVVSFAYLRLLIFLPRILILACESSRLAFCMMYSA